jgi:hypothetical protein
MFGIQLVLWIPHRRVPNDDDRLAAANLCAHVARAVRCGEPILVDLGSTCLANAGVTQVPKDRFFSVLEFFWANLAAEPGTLDRIRSEEYGVLALHLFPPPGPWPPELIQILNEHYVPYVTLPPGQLTADIMFDFWQNLQPPVVLFERKRDQGLHAKATDGVGCDDRKASTKIAP